MMQSKYKIIAILAVLALVGCQARTSSPATAPQTATVTRGTLTALVNAAGTVNAKSQATLAFPASGQVKEIDVLTGDHVKAGQVLAKLDTTDLELAVAQAQVNLDTAKTKLAQTQAGPKPADVASAQSSLASAYSAYQAALTKNNLTDSQLTVARAQVDKTKAALARAQLAYQWEVGNWLDKNPLNSQQKTDLDNAQTAYDLAQAAYNQAAAGINTSPLQAAAAQVAQAQYQLDSLKNTPTPQDLVIAQQGVKQAEAGLAQAQMQLANAVLVAPFDGTVADVSVQVGQMVDSSVGAVILADLSQLDIALTVAETDEPKVKVGQEAQVTLDAVPGVTFAGRVDEMDLVGTMTQGVVNYPATVVMTDTSGQVRPGMNATVSVIVEQRDSVLLVPNRAVQTQGRAHLVTVLYQGQQIQTPVTIGLSGDTQTEVVDGLREGDIVLLNATTATTARGGPGGGFIVRPPGD
jgi:HlyD family secretion protein